MMKWIFRELNIYPNSYTEFILPDIVRYIITVLFPTNTLGTGITQRWQTLHYILDNSKNEIVKSLIKQNIFFDWMFYSPKKDSVMLVEPGLTLIKNTFMINPLLCQELLEFLFLFCEQ